jgi:hypothetical protein
MMFCKLSRPFERIEAYASPRQAVNFPDGSFFGVRIEQHEKYDIRWFVWEKDGIVPKQIIPEDWEPVILFWHDKELVRVTVRLHYEWVDYSAANLDEPHFALPLRIIFAGSNHGPLVRRRGEDPIFDMLLSSEKSLEFDPQVIREDQVPQYARKGLFNRHGIFVSVGQGIHERAQETLREINESLGY